MNSRRNATHKRRSDEEIDNFVEAQAGDDAAWTRPVRVRPGKPASLSIPAELAARAAFLAKLHREKNIEAWLKRVIKERVELEEVAFVAAKRELSLKNGV